MKKRNYILVIVLAIVLSLSFFGCGDGTDDRTGTGGGSNTNNEKILNIYVCNGGYGLSWLDQAKDGFKEQTGITVNIKKFNTLDQDYKSVLSLLSEGKSKKSIGTFGDLYFTGIDNWLRFSSQENSQLADLSDLDIVKNKTLDERIIDWGSRSDWQDGKSRMFVLHPNIAMETFIYNQAYLDKIESKGAYTKGEWPTTWQGLLDLCEQLVVNMDSKIDNKQVIPYGVYLSDAFDTQKLYETLFAQGNYGQDYKNYFNLELDSNSPTPEDKSAYVNDSFANAMYALKQFLRVDQKNGLNNYKYFKSYQDDVDSGDVMALRGFLQGETLFCWHGSFFGTEAANLIENNNLIGDNYKIGVVPTISGNEKETTVNLNWPHEFLSIPKQADHVDNAKAFLNYVYRDENLINIVKAMNAIPGIKHTYTEKEINSAGRWTQDVIKTYVKYSDTTNYPNGISFRASHTYFYRLGYLNSLNRNTKGTEFYFPTSLINYPNDYNKESAADYKVLLEDFYEKGIKYEWQSSWATTFGF